MHSIFNEADVQHLSARINRLTPDTKPLWGKMDVAQMLAHLQVPMKVLKGESKMKRGLMGWLFGGIAKKQMLSEKPFKQNLPTDRTFIMSDAKNFEEEKLKTIALLNDIQKAGASAVTKSPHPFFGKLTAEQWDLLGWKHMDHHLRQFGV